MPQRVRIVLQARTTSERLPGKVFLPIAGIPLAILCARRLATTGREVVLATSTEQTDDLLTEVVRAAGFQVFRGPLNDVLDRYVQCLADMGDEDLVVRATADNPLPSGKFVDTLIRAIERVDGDYLGTSSPSDGLPYGVSAEVFSVAALRRVASLAVDAADREHVTASLRASAGAAGIAPPGLFLAEDMSHLRATIDTLPDFLAMAAVFESVSMPVECEWEYLLPRLPRRRK